MARQKKTNRSVIPPVPREAMAAVGTAEDFVELLRREFEWSIPMNMQRLGDVVISQDLHRRNGQNTVKVRGQGKRHEMVGEGPESGICQE